MQSIEVRQHVLEAIMYMVIMCCEASVLTCTPPSNATLLHTEQIV